MGVINPHDRLFSWHDVIAKAAQQVTYQVPLHSKTPCQFHVIHPLDHAAVRARFTINTVRTAFHVFDATFALLERVARTQALSMLLKGQTVD